MSRPEKLTLAQQQYVETIADLIRERGEARTTDLAERLDVSLPSASQAVGRLIDMGLARRKSWHEIILTAQGRAISRQLGRRHQVFRRFLTRVLRMSAKAADANACRIEHCIDPGLADRLGSFADFFERELPAGAKARWLQKIGDAGERRGT